MLVVDTNIVVALFINGKFTRHANALFKADAAWCTEPLALVEFCNVLCTYHRAKLASAEDAQRYLEAAQTFLMPHLHSVATQTALDFALRYRVTGYDAHFLAVAEAHGKQLITADGKLRAAAPMLTQSLDEALAPA
jgi:predicted nucleic acid-binding protein